MPSIMTDTPRGPQRVTHLSVRDRRFDADVGGLFERCAHTRYARIVEQHLSSWSTSAHGTEVGEPPDPSPPRSEALYVGEQGDDLSRTAAIFLSTTAKPLRCLNDKLEPRRNRGPLSTRMRDSCRKQPSTSWGFFASAFDFRVRRQPSPDKHHKSREDPPCDRGAVDSRLDTRQEDAAPRRASSPYRPGGGLA